MTYRYTPSLSWNLCLQIATILYAPGKPGWSKESHTNIEFATVFFTWHLAAIIVFLAIVYFLISVVTSSKKCENQFNTQV